MNGFILPRQVVGQAAGWRFHDWRTLDVDAEWEDQQVWYPEPAPSSSRPRVELPQVPQDELWFLSRFVVQADAGDVASEVRFYLDSVTPRRCVGGAEDGSYTAGDTNSPILIPGGQVLIARWEGDFQASDFPPGDGELGYGFDAWLSCQVAIMRRD